MADAPSEQLFELCQQSFWSPDPIKVHQLVEEGADVMHTPDSVFLKNSTSKRKQKKQQKGGKNNTKKEYGEEEEEVMLVDETDEVKALPVLFHLVYYGEVECVKACLTTRQPIHFTHVEGKWRRNLLHYICDYKVPEEACVAMLELVVQRLQRRAVAAEEEDSLDWAQQDVWGLDLLCTAAYRMRLHSVWRVLRHVSYFQAIVADCLAFNAAHMGDSFEVIAEQKREDIKTVIPMQFIYAADWKQMTPEEQREFTGRAK